MFPREEGTHTVIMGRYEVTLQIRKEGSHFYAFLFVEGSTSTAIIGFDRHTSWECFNKRVDKLEENLLLLKPKALYVKKAWDSVWVKGESMLDVSTGRLLVKGKIYQIKPELSYQQMIYAAEHIISN